MMAELSRDDIRRLVGPVDETVVADIIALGTTPEELAEAHAWLNGDEYLLNEGRSPPAGRAQRILDLLELLDREAAEPEP
jgi:hypothetical protein